MEQEHLPLSPVSPTTPRHTSEPDHFREPFAARKQIDEEPPTPLPRKQLAILLLLLLTEPVSGFVIYPFIAKLVGELDIINGEQASIGYYVGLIESLFYVAQGLTVLQWGRLSDRIGRRPVILIGQLGLAASLLTFGYSKTFAGIVVGRSLAGFLDGNVGVVKTMLGELTDDSNRARAFSLFPVTWITGATLAPLVGGALEHPAERFPSIFGPSKSTFWTEYPYMLPCLWAAALCFVTFVLGAAFLKETLDVKSVPVHEHGGYQPLGQDPSVVPEVDQEQTEDRPLRAEEVHRTEGGSPPMSAVFVRPVLTAVLNYGTLAMLDIAYFSIATVFFAVPVSAGGLNFTPFKIGMIFASLGTVSGVVQVFIFPKVHKRFGAKLVLRVASASFFLVFPLFPLMHIAAVRFGSNSFAVGALIFVLVCTNPMIDMGYSCSFMFVTSSSPSPNLLGSVNGLAQTVVSMVRAIGPAGATALFSLSTNRQWMGGYAIYWLMCALTAATLWSTTLLPKSDRSDHKAKQSMP